MSKTKVKTTTDLSTIPLLSSSRIQDVVQQFCTKHLGKIRTYVESLSSRVPIPVKCSIEEAKHRKFAKLHFMCFGKGDLCLFNRFELIRLLC